MTELRTEVFEEFNIDPKKQAAVPKALRCTMTFRYNFFSQLKSQEAGDANVYTLLLIFFFSFMILIYIANHVVDI